MKILYIFFISILAACQPNQDSPSNDPTNNPSNYKLPYNLSTPSHVYYLPEAIREISGIQIMGEDVFACVQDEVGKVFIYDGKENKITRSLPFTGGGDYEDLVVRGNECWVVESNGTLHHL